MLEVLEPTIGPLKLVLVWSAAEDCKSRLDCLHFGHIVVAFKESERSLVAFGDQAPKFVYHHVSSGIEVCKWHRG